MNTPHFSEMEIQQYAVDPAISLTTMRSHLDSCAQCQARVREYQQLFVSLRELPKSVFAADFSTRVMQELPQVSSKSPAGRVYVYGISFVSVTAFLVCLYQFRKYLIRFFSGILPITMYLILIMALLILIFQGLEMFRRYQKQMQLLN